MTRKPACVAIREARLQMPTVPGNSSESTNIALPPGPAQAPSSVSTDAIGASSTDESLLNFPDIDMYVPPVPFKGDFFGEYGDADFEVAGPSPSESSSHSESSDDDVFDTQGWEPDPHPAPSDVSHAFPTTDAPATGPVLPSHARRENVEHTIPRDRNTFIIHFPGSTAGAPVPDGTSVPNVTYQDYQASVESPGTSSTNPYAPFTSRIDWEVAQWAKLRGSGSTAFSDLLAIEEVCPSALWVDVILSTHVYSPYKVAERLSLSYKNSRELNNIIDTKLPPGRPPFQRHEIIVAGEAFEVFYRDILQCIEALFGDPEFAPILLLVPERHYADSEHTVRVYFDMNTGKWWWSTQVRIVYYPDDHPCHTHTSSPLLGRA